MNKEISLLILLSPAPSGGSISNHTLLSCCRVDLECLMQVGSLFVCVLAFYYAFSHRS
jgi:hypothetical protein